MTGHVRVCVLVNVQVPETLTIKMSSHATFTSFSVTHTPLHIRTTTWSHCLKHPSGCYITIDVLTCEASSYSHVGPYNTAVSGFSFLTAQVSPTLLLLW